MIFENKTKYDVISMIALKVDAVKNSCLVCGDEVPAEHEGWCKNPFLVSDLIRESEKLRVALKEVEAVLDKHGQI